MSVISDGEAEEQHLSSEPCKMSQDTRPKFQPKMKLMRLLPVISDRLGFIALFFLPIILYCNLIS